MSEVGVDVHQPHPVTGAGVPFTGHLLDRTKPPVHGVQSFGSPADDQRAAVRRRPYTVHLNDIASFDFPGFNPAAYEQQLIDEFDQLYAEGAARRRMMVIGLHERISGHGSRVRVLDRIFTRLREHADV